MRTTVTLDPDTEALIKRLMNERGLTFKEALNRAIRLGLGPSEVAEASTTPTFSMGFNPSVPWDKALALAGQLEDEEAARKLSIRK